MRPDFERILENDVALQCFRNFANSQHVLESLDCLVDIKRYKKLLLKLYPQMNSEMVAGRRFSTFSNHSQGSNSGIMTTTPTTVNSPVSPSHGNSVNSPTFMNAKHGSCHSKRSIFSSFFSISYTSSSTEREIETISTLDSPKELPFNDNNTIIPENKEESTETPKKGFSFRRLSLRKKPPPILDRIDSNTDLVVTSDVKSPQNDPWIHRDSIISALESHDDPKPGTVSLFDDASSITSYETSNSISVRSPLSLLRFPSNDDKERQLQEKVYYCVLQMIDNYLKDGAPSGINVDGSSKRQILNNDSLASLNRFTHDLDFMTKYNLFNRVELQLLLLIKGDVLPRFAQSEMWQQFVLQNGKLADSCCYPEDLQKVERLKYRKADFLREYITNKDLEFSEMAAGDMSCLQHMLGSSDLSVFFSKGRQFVDTEEVGFGTFNMAKVVGFLPFPAEVVVSAQCSAYATKKFLPTTKFDENSQGIETPFLPHEYELIDFSDDSKKHIYPSWLTKFNVAFPKPFGMRTCYAAGKSFMSGLFV